MNINFLRILDILNGWNESNCVALCLASYYTLILKMEAPASQMTMISSITRPLLGRCRGDYIKFKYCSVDAVFIIV